MRLLTLVRESHDVKKAATLLLAYEDAIALLYVNSLCTLRYNSAFMVLETVILQVKNGCESNFEEAFKKASRFIVSANGYLSHELHRCIEVQGKYILLVRWKSLESHTIGFRKSPQYQEWKQLLHHFYEPFPEVKHFEEVAINVFGLKQKA